MINKEGSLTSSHSDPTILWKELMALLAFWPTSRLSVLGWRLLDLTRTLLLTGPSRAVLPGKVGRPVAMLRPCQSSPSASHQTVVLLCCLWNNNG